MSHSKFEIGHYVIINFTFQSNIMSHITVDWQKYSAVSETSHSKNQIVARSGEHHHERKSTFWSYISTSVHDDASLFIQCANEMQPSSTWIKYIANDFCVTVGMIIAIGVQPLLLQLRMYRGDMRVIEMLRYYWNLWQKVIVKIVTAQPVWNEELQVRYLWESLSNVRDEWLQCGLEFHLGWMSNVGVTRACATFGKHFMLINNHSSFDSRSFNEMIY